MALTISKTYLVKANLRIGVGRKTPNYVWKNKITDELNIEQF